MIKLSKYPFKASLFIFTMIIQSLLTAQAEDRLDSNRINDFLNLISSNWRGTAVQTPIGRVTYNIEFLKDTNGQVTGAAFLHRSTHYWVFYPQEDKLKLKFLSTFAGNDRPIFFHALHYSQDGYEFSSISRNDVKVFIKPEKQEMTIRIFLRNQAHVKIELEKM